MKLNVNALHRLRTALVSVLTLTLCATAEGGPFQGRWIPHGPSPGFDGQVERIVPDNEVTGAIHTVAAHPTNPDILVVGAVNGGIWRTQNATKPRPNWKNVTPFSPSLSIGALEFDPTNSLSMMAGIGRYSSYARIGGERLGLLRSTDGGQKWNAIEGGGVLFGKNISGVAIRGDVLLASVDMADRRTVDQFGLFRSTDAGNTFTQVSGAADSGLPPGACNDLVGDPGKASRLYTSVVFASQAGHRDGIYRTGRHRRHLDQGLRRPDRHVAQPQRHHRWQCRDGGRTT